MHVDDDRGHYTFFPFKINRMHDYLLSISRNYRPGRFLLVPGQLKGYLPNPN